MKSLKKTPKRAFAVLLAVLMLMSIAPLTAFAGGQGVSNNEVYGDILDDGTVEIYGCNDESDSMVIIPSEIEGLTVTSVNFTGFDYYTGSKDTYRTVVIPETVKSISDSNGHIRAAIGAINVSPDNPYYSSEDGVVFNKEKTDIVYYPNDKPDTSYKLPKTVTRIRGDFYFGDKLAKLTIPSSVKEIDINFKSHLSEIEVDFANPKYKSIDGVLFEKVDDGLKLIKYPSYRQEETGTYTVPNGVTGVGDYAFKELEYGLNLILPASLTDITFNSFNPVEIPSVGKNAVEGIHSITVDSANLKYCSQNGVLFNKDKTELVYFPSNASMSVYTIPDGVERINNFNTFFYPFSVVIPASVKEIGDYAFCYNNDNFIGFGLYYSGTKEDWEKINIGAGNKIKKIAYDSLFTYNVMDDGTAMIMGSCCTDSNLSIPAEIDGYTVTAVNGAIFFAYNDYVKNFNIPKTVKDIVVENMNWLYGKSFNVDSENEFYSSDEGVLFNKDKSILLRYPTEKEDVNYTVPSETKVIGNYAFAESYCLEEATVPDNVIAIGQGAFNFAYSLKKVNILGSVDAIRASTFEGCVNLREVYIPNSVKYIRKGAFSYCNALSDIYYRGTKAQWDEIVIKDDNAPLFNATIHYNYVPSADIIASGNCGSTTQWKLDSNGILTISGTGIVKNYDKASLVPWNKYASQIKNVVVEEGVTRIGEFAFYGCTNLTSVTLPNSLVEISGYVFKNCSSLTQITLPKNLMKIGDSAFYGTGLTRLTIPAHVNYIGWYAFSRCHSLKNVEFMGNAPEFAGKAFNMMTATVNYPANNSTWTTAKKQPYGGTIKWLQKGLIDEGLCGSTTSWKLSNDGTLTISGTGIVKNYSAASLVPWLKYASQIKKVVVEEGITRIGEFAFYGCTNLTSVTLPNSLKEINGYVFKNCSALTEITLPSGLTKIGDSAFYGTGLTSIVIPSKVNYIGYYAFSRCYSLSNIEFKGSAPAFCTNVFNKVVAFVYYPAGNSSWNSVAWNKLGGTLTAKTK